MGLHAFILLVFHKTRKKRNSAARLQKQDNPANNPRPESNHPATFMASNHAIEHGINAEIQVDTQTPLPIFDPQQGIQLTFGDAEIWKTILGMLFDNLPDYSINLIAAKHNMEDLRQTAHKLVSASCYCGTPAMNHAAKHVERLAKAGNMDAATQALDILLQQIARLLTLKNEGNLHLKKDPIY